MDPSSSSGMPEKREEGAPDPRTRPGISYDGVSAEGLTRRQFKSGDGSIILPLGGEGSQMEPSPPSQVPEGKKR